MINFFNGKKITKVYIGYVDISSSSNAVVSYHIDTDHVMQIPLASGADALTRYTPSKEGWTFVGWRDDAVASGNVLTNKVVGNESLSLYAVYSQNVTLSYNGNGSTSGSVSSQTGTRYYNAYGNYSNPSFSLASNGFSKTNYTFNKWAMGSTSGTQYSSGATVTLSESTTFYAVWNRNSNPVYWLSGASNGEGGTVTSGYPTKWTVTYTDVNCDHPEDCDIYIRDDIREIYCTSAEEWWVNAQATGSTGNNQYMEIVVSQMAEGRASITCNGTTISKAGTYIINVDGLSSVTMYASLHWWSDPGYFSIDSIRFY